LIFVQILKSNLEDADENKLEELLLYKHEIHESNFDDLKMMSSASTAYYTNTDNATVVTNVIDVVIPLQSEDGKNQYPSQDDTTIDLSALVAIVIDIAAAIAISSKLQNFKT